MMYDMLVARVGKDKELGFTWDKYYSELSALGFCESCKEVKITDVVQHA